MGLHFEKPSWAALSPGSFTKNYLYSPTFDSDLERVEDVVRRARKHQTRIHRLMDDDGTHYGFVALSIGVLSEKPCLVIDYLFVSQIYRGEVYGELGDITIGKFLLSYAFSLAQEANVNYPIRYIALEPANAKLEIYYLSAGFSKLDATRFMFLKLGSWPNE